MESIETSLHNQTSTTWSFTPVSILIISPLAIIINGYFLIIFAINKNLHTPFNVYLGNLLLANLLYSILNNPLDIVNSVHTTWPLSSTACNVYIYSLTALGAMTIQSHVLISINRLFAVIFPVVFRNHHNFKTAFLAVIAMWICVHAVCLPGIVRGALFYRLSFQGHRCVVDPEAQYIWNTVMQFVLYLIPVSVILLTYPFLLFKHKQRQRIRLSSRRAISVVGARQNMTPKVGQTPESGNKTASKEYPVKDERYRAFVITSLLTLSISICWAPNVTFYTVAGFVKIESPDVVYEMMGLLFALQSVTDPILFALVLQDLRSALIVPGRKIVDLFAGWKR